MQGGTHEQVASFHLGPTSEPPEELLDPMATWATWAVPYKQLSIDQQRAAWFMDGNSKVKGQHPVWKAATLIEEGKNKSARWAELHDVWPYVWVLLTHGKCLMAWPCGQAEGQWKTGLVKGFLYGTWPYRNHSGNARGILK